MLFDMAKEMQVGINIEISNAPEYSCFPRFCPRFKTSTSNLLINSVKIITFLSSNKILGKIVCYIAQWFSEL